MNKESRPPGDETMIRCPRLGHEIYFSYCRTENKGLPCAKIMDCWHNHFMIEDFLRKELGPGEWERVFHTPPKPKILSLVELIEEAKRSSEEK